MGNGLSSRILAAPLSAVLIESADFGEPGAGDQSSRGWLLDFDICRLDASDCDAVDGLMKANSGTLGFLPREALLGYLGSGGALGAKRGDGQLAAYTLFAPRRNGIVRIAHLCVSKAFNGQGLAKRLVDRLVEDSRRQGLDALDLHCRRDYPANAMWPKLKFIPLGRKPGRGSTGKTLVYWRRTLKSSAQADFIYGDSETQGIEVVIDSVVLFDFDKPDDDESALTSKALLSDFLVGAINIRVTDETLVEINRDDDISRQERSRQRALSLVHQHSDSEALEQISEALKNVLPVNSQNDESDINQLAKTAALNVAYFVTRDSDLLKASDSIFETTGVQVVSPTQLILEINAASPGTATSEHVLGDQMQWRRLSSDDRAHVEAPAFLRKGERKYEFARELDAYLAAPADVDCQVLDFIGDIAAVRVMSRTDEARVLRIHLGRVTHRSHPPILDAYFIMSFILKAVSDGFDAVTVGARAVTENLRPYLDDFGFIDLDGSFTRFCFSEVMSRDEALARVEALQPRAVDGLARLSPVQLEGMISPVCIREAQQAYLLVPVRPGYAINIVDFGMSASELFGGQESLLLRWDNVYYRSAKQHRKLAPPGRILWYVTGKNGRIVSVSHLDGVEIGEARELFKKHRKRGTLEWSDVVGIADGDPAGEVMALMFSNTIPLRREVTLDEARGVFSRHGKALPLQSPLRLQAGLFQDLFKLGFPERAST